VPVDIEKRLLQGVTVRGNDQQKANCNQCLSCFEPDADKQSCYQLEKRDALAGQLEKPGWNPGIGKSLHKKLLGVACGR